MNPTSYFCSRCGAEPGEPCLRNLGWKLEETFLPHAERERLARADGWDREYDPSVASALERDWHPEVMEYPR